MRNRPIRVTPNSGAQRDEIEAFAQVKGFRSASGFMLFATVSYMTRIGLTEAQKAKVKEIIKEQSSDAPALEHSANQGTLEPPAITHKTFLDLVANVVPQNERKDWILKAKNGQDLELLKTLCKEIESRFKNRPRSVGGGKVTIHEYIDLNVPEKERERRHHEVEELPRNPESIGEYFGMIQMIYGYSIRRR